MTQIFSTQYKNEKMIFSKGPFVFSTDSPSYVYNFSDDRWNYFTLVMYGQPNCTANEQPQLASDFVENMGFTNKISTFH